MSLHLRSLRLRSRNGNDYRSRGGRDFIGVNVGLALRETLQDAPNDN